MRINVQFSDPATTRSLWSETYERDVKDVLAAQSEIVNLTAQAVAKVLGRARQMTRIRVRRNGSSCWRSRPAATDRSRACRWPVFLSPEGVNHTQSRFSPDGSRVAYWTPGIDGLDLIVANADLSEPRTAASHNVQTTGIVWSPDGKQFAVRDQ